jgi:hypothetical protein
MKVSYTASEDEGFAPRFTFEKNPFTEDNAEENPEDNAEENAEENEVY